MTDGATAKRWAVLAWLRLWPRRHPMLTDALALVIVLPAAFERPESSAPWHNPVLWGVLLTVPLIVRRRYPMVVFGCVAVVAAAQWLLSHAMIVDLALLVALYTVAANRDHVRAAVAWALLEIGVLMAVGRGANHRGPGAPVVFFSRVGLAAVM